MVTIVVGKVVFPVLCIVVLSVEMCVVGTTVVGRVVISVVGLVVFSDDETNYHM